VRPCLREREREREGEGDRGERDREKKTWAPYYSMSEGNLYRNNNPSLGLAVHLDSAKVSGLLTPNWKN
jgi:hypothetical protein